MKKLLKFFPLILALALVAPMYSIAQTTISGLPAATTLSGTELLAGVQGTTTKKITAAQVATLATGAGQTWTGNPIGVAYGGLGVNNSAATGVPLFTAGSIAFTGTSGTGTFARTNTPTFINPALGAATATSINGLSLTASTGTLTIANGKTFTSSNTWTATATDSASVNFGAGGTVLYSGGAYVSSIAGTANEITASGATGAVTLSLPSALTFTGKTITGGSYAAPTVTGSFTATGLVTNADLVNAATTVNGQTCTLGSTCTVTASATNITVGTTTVTSGTNGGILYNSAGTLANSAAITGLVLGAGTSSPTVYGGTTCTNQFPRSLNASGAATCASVAIGTDVSGLGAGVATLLTGASSGTGGPAGTASPTFTGTLSSANHTITSASANAMAVGLNGATNPAFNVDASTASQAAGLKVTGAATGGTVAVVTTDSGSNTNLTLNAKGSGTIGIGSVSTGAVTITPATTIGGNLTTNVTGSTQCLQASTAGVVSGTGSSCASVSSQTRQVFLSGTAATYTTPANVRQLIVLIKAGGGGTNGSGGAGTTAGGTGGTTTFNSVNATGGSPGSSSGAGSPGIGGTGGTGTGTNIVRIAGAPGTPPSLNAWSATNYANYGGTGGGAGGGASVGSNGSANAGNAGVANTGGGAGGASLGNATLATLSSLNNSAGGGEGETAWWIINSPSASYTYTVGAGGSAGAAGATGGAGALGGSGFIQIIEAY